MTVLITGAAGFIGSNLAHYLNDKGYDMILLDNFSTGKIINIAKFKDKILKGDIYTDYKYEQIKNKKYYKEKNVDTIVNLAAFSSAPMFQEKQIYNRNYMINNNIIGFRNILELARGIDAKVIYASTSSLYSNENHFLESKKVSPNSWYEYTKICNEHDANIYEKLYGLKTIGLRFFSIYGYNELHKGKYANLVSQFLWDMELGKQPTIYGLGGQTRDFTWVGDVCKVIQKIMEYDLSWPYKVLNVGTGMSVSLNSLVNKINSILNTNIKPKYIKNPIKNYVYRTRADTEKLFWFLKYIPNTWVHDGILNLVERKTFYSTNT